MPRAAHDDVALIVQGLRRITRAVELYSHEVQREFGLTGPQLWALKNLHREGSMTAGQLAASLAVDKSSVSGLLRRLENRGLITRSRDPRDRRVVRIDLTAEARALAHRAPEAAQGRLLHGLNAMPARSVATLRMAIERLVRAMEAADIEARFFFSDD